MTDDEIMFRDNSMVRNKKQDERRRENTERRVALGRRE
jgi:hypothetical protein